jgi:hypothetical protein
MPVPAATTRLEAINQMRAVLGEAPINSISGPVNADIAMALSTLDEVLKEVLCEGWHFNREREVPLAPDINGKIAVPADVIELDSDYHDVIAKDGFVYDRVKRTDVWSGVSQLKVDVVYYKDFEQIPEAARKYVTARAARKLYGRRNGHQVPQDLVADEATMRLRLMQQEADSADHSIFDNAGTFGVLNRLRPLDTL